MKDGVRLPALVGEAPNGWLIEGRLEVKLPTIYGQMEQERWQESVKGRRKKIREEKESEEGRCRCAKR